MKLQANYVEKPLKKLRKQLSQFPSKPQPEDVHSLRTYTRRLEATVAALALDREKEARSLLKLIKPVRKAAGKVRDMDVLIADVLSLSDHQESEALVRLVEHLAKMRMKSARKLHEIVRGCRGDASQRIRDSSKLVRKRLKNGSAGVDTDAGPQILVTELSHWPDLDANNLHVFRIRIKELRYMLQLSDQTDEKLVNDLGNVKDTIGEWHDWVELLRIAQKVLDPRADNKVLNRIGQIGEQKLHIALAAANHVRQRYFAGGDGRKASRKVLQMAVGY